METDDELAAWAEQVKTDTQDSNIKTTNDYSGGYSDGTVSVMYTKLVNEEGLTALKTYIQLNSITICLGTDITCTKENNEKFINTSIEQCYLNNASYNGQSIDGTVITVTDNKAIYNGAFAYYNLDTDKVLHVDCREVEGSASRVVAGASTAVTTADIFKVWLEHGYDPDGDKYAYAIRATGDGNAPADASGLGIVKIENSSDMQIIEFDDGTIAGVFHNTSAIYETATGSELSPEDGETVVIKNPIL